MCEQYEADIEHPNQDDWSTRGKDGYLDDTHKAVLADRYADLSSVIEVQDLFDALDEAAKSNHEYRTVQDEANKSRLSITINVSDTPQPSALKHEYDGLTGRSEKVGDFVNWFSSISHQAFVSQESLPPELRFQHVSLELGGASQLGDWDADQGIEQMAASIPGRVLESAPGAHLTVYGQNWSKHLNDKRVTYVDRVPQSYVLIPKPIDTPRRFDFDYPVLRQRFPFADIYLHDQSPDQSDVVIFGERIAVVVMPLVEKRIRDAIIDDCWSVALASDDANQRVKLQDTPGARMAGVLFEHALRSPVGTTKDITPVSVHYVQGVGEKFAQLRAA